VDARRFEAFLEPTAGNYDQFPTFNFREQPLAGVMGSAGAGLLMLLGPAAVVGLAGFRRLRIIRSWIGDWLHLYLKLL
jgi:hypothetical protein